MVSRTECSWTWKSTPATERLTAIQQWSSRLHDVWETETTRRRPQVKDYTLSLILLITFAS